VSQRGFICKGFSFCFGDSSTDKTVLAKILRGTQEEKSHRRAISEDGVDSLKGAFKAHVLLTLSCALKVRRRKMNSTLLRLLEVEKIASPILVNEFPTIPKRASVQISCDT
jgi:hypothetical protein